MVLDCGGAVAWPIGGRVAVASTDFDKDQAETFLITSGNGGHRDWVQYVGPVNRLRLRLNPCVFVFAPAVTPLLNNQVRLGLDHSFLFMHYGKYQGLADGLGGYVDERAEVALLSRRITIFGTAEAAPYNLEGEVAQRDRVGKEALPLLGFIQMNV